MSSKRPSFAKREREMKLKDKARAKVERRAARRAEDRTSDGPPIATSEATGLTSPTTDTGPDASALTANPPVAGRSR